MKNNSRTVRKSISRKSSSPVTRHKSRITRAKTTSHRSPVTSHHVDWIPALAEPYLRGYIPRRETRHGLNGYTFTSPASTATNQIGFFIGFITRPAQWSFLQHAEPECAVFAFVEPAGSEKHRELVTAPKSLFRTTFEFIRYLTHRPPRFQFFEHERSALIRHIPLSAWPAARTHHYARNFFIETLAWLVRSALVRRLQ